MLDRAETAPEIHLCSVSEQASALGVLYHRMPASLRPHLVARALEEAERGELDLSGVWVARRRGRVVGAMLTQHLAGRAAAVWAPEVTITWGRAAMAAALVRSALDDLAARGVRIAQALLDETAPRQAGDDLRRGGIPRVTELVYMTRDTALPLEVPEAVPPLQWRTFDTEIAGEFRNVLEATYSASLDMPELEGARTLDDVLASHRAAGRFDPSRWWLAHVPGEPDAAMVLLLASQLPGREAWEIAYLGLTPPARSRGLGRAAIAHALTQARPYAARLELAVDTRNLPAARLYRSTGFTTYDRRTVHLAVLGT